MEHTFRRQVRQLKRNESGVAMIEFAVSLPFFMGLVIGGFETANYASVIMQINQITLHTADAAARIGTTTPFANKTISETQINDVFQGSLHEGKRINLGGNHDYTDPSTKVKSTRGNARIILSSVEEVAAFNASAPRYRIRWQRCAGSATFYKSNYGTALTATSVTGVGPVGQPATPPPGGVLMFVELQYYFKPMIVNGFSNLTDRTISQVASMVVRENRDTVGPTGSDGIYNNERVTVSTC